MAKPTEYEMESRHGPILVQIRHALGTLLVHDEVVNAVRHLVWHGAPHPGETHETTAHIGAEDWVVTATNPATPATAEDSDG